MILENSDEDDEGNTYEASSKHHKLNSDFDGWPMLKL